MRINSISDFSTEVLRAALNGLDARQQAISANLSNLETPGYLSREVSFEDSLRNAIRSGDVSGASVSVTRSLAPTRLNGNNVNIDNEIMASAENGLHQRLVVEGLNAKYKLLRTAITGR